MPSTLQAEEILEEESIEILDTIEVPATAVTQEKRPISFLAPQSTELTPLIEEQLVRPSIRSSLPVTIGHHPVARDSIADTRGVRSPARAAKAERPHYPHVARKNGWEGTVFLRVTINADGTVRSIKTQKSSGHSILDESALRTVKQWRFEPAKDGEFPIPVTVDLPIRFDLNE